MLRLHEETDGATGIKTKVPECTWSSYFVAFAGNGATSGSMDTLRLPLGQDATLSANALKRTNYKFTGWNTSADGSGQEYSDKATVRDLTTHHHATVTLYAQWEKQSSASSEFADDAGSWNVWGTIKWRVADDTLYIRPKDSPDGEGTIGQRDKYGRDESAPWTGAARDTGAARYVTRIASSGTIHVHGASNGLFNGLEKLTDISDLAEWVIDPPGEDRPNLGGMFSGCKSLADVSPLSGWDTSAVAYIDNMFGGCTVLEDATALEGWDVSKAWSPANAFDSSLSNERRPTWARSE